ncbi:cyclin-dependent kinase 4 inhibitor C [Erpetoichthys calabaricus]|uniref:Cyclin-dependent kinase inhibitor 2C (p18, inhibits CDK4) n=1 Tax=Erpetoichthys calabaricus TaxID=27687 RepID=A0A8C4S9P1_ERPCA|nr:cyclin-dependent kinase 4 inhibitor C [Erpetoichthys calabaricus]
MTDSTDADELANASARGDLRVVQMLLQSGVNVNQRNTYGRTPLQVMKLGYPAIAVELLRANANPNEQDISLGVTIAHDAAREGFLETLMVLTENGADVNLQDHRGNLPLHLAAREGHLDIVRHLIDLTIDPLVRNKEGHTASDLAEMHDRHLVAQWLGTRLQR